MRLKIIQRLKTADITSLSPSLDLVKAVTQSEGRPEYAQDGVEAPTITKQRGAEAPRSFV